MHRQLHDGLAYWRRNAPDTVAVAIDDDDTALTYEALGRWSDGIARHLAGIGVAPGDRIGLIGANSLVWVASAFGILKAGGVIVPYNPKLSDDSLAYLLDLADIRLVIADAPQAGRIAGLTPTLPIVAKTDMEGCRDGVDAGWRAADPRADRLAMIIFTSGSTGRPKGVMVSHERQLAKYYELMAAEPSFGAGSRIFMPLAMHAAAGTQWGFMFATNIGATCYFTAAFAPDRALATLVDARISAFMAISMMYDRIARCAAFPHADLSAIRFAQAGGMRLAAGTLPAWRAKGVVIRQVYGLTEIGGIGIMASHEEAEARPEACGRGMIHTNVRVLQPNGQPATADEPGDVLLRSPGLMLGYWRNPDATAATVAGDWLRTGDIGLLDADGHFTFMDRAGDMIGQGDARVSPSEVEIAIGGIDDVLEVAVAGVPRSGGGEAIHAWVHGHAGLTSSRIIDVIRQRLPNHKLPQHIIITGAPLPRMLSGKIDRIALRKQAAESVSLR